MFHVTNRADPDKPRIQGCPEEARFFLFRTAFKEGRYLGQAFAEWGGGGG